MITAVIALALALTIALGSIAYLVRSLLSGLKSERASFAAEILAGKAQVAAELAQRHAERTRDEALAAQAKAEAEKKAALAQLADTATELERALKENADAAVTKIRSASTPELAYDALVELFAIVPKGATAPVPIVPASVNRSDAGPDALLPADVALAPGTGRDS